MAPTAALEIDGLTIRYGDTLAVDRLDLRIAAGETVALLGPNGAGKSSTVNAAPRLLRPAARPLPPGGRPRPAGWRDAGPGHPYRWGRRDAAARWPAQ